MKKGVKLSTGHQHNESMMHIAILRAAEIRNYVLKVLNLRGSKPKPANRKGQDPTSSLEAG